MIVPTPRGTEWRLDDVPRKLALRAELPGARVFDLAAQALRRARVLGLDDAERLALALPASWLVNSPAVSRVLRRWALPPQREVWLDLLATIDGGVEDASDAGAGDRRLDLLRALGDEPYAVEAISKVLALLAPHAVPLMPAAARLFVLGTEEASPATFVAMVDWFGETAATLDEPLTEIARGFDAVPLDAAQVLDRALWFDSEGYRHFEAAKG